VTSDQEQKLSNVEMVLQWAIALAMLAATLLMVARCSFTAIRYEDPDCSKCALQCPDGSLR
jgi:hypothetical protein